MQGQPNARTRQLPVRKTGGEIVHIAVDEIDWLWAQHYNWHLNAGYVARNQRRGAERKIIRIFLHREILGLKHGYRHLWVDHINGDPLDNRRCNLRAVTPAQNAQNRKSRAGSTSQYSGVYWNKREKKWKAQIMVDGRLHLVGYFTDEHEAGRAAAAFRTEHGLLQRAA